MAGNSGRAADAAQFSDLSIPESRPKCKLPRADRRCCDATRYGGINKGSEMRRESEDSRAATCSAGINKSEYGVCGAWIVGVVRHEC